MRRRLSSLSVRPWRIQRIPRNRAICGGFGVFFYLVSARGGRSGYSISPSGFGPGRATGVLDIPLWLRPGAGDRGSARDGRPRYCPGTGDRGIAPGRAVAALNFSLFCPGRTSGARIRAHLSPSLSENPPKNLLTYQQFSAILLLVDKSTSIRTID